MFCPKCGRECKDGRFCMGCGTDGEGWDAESIKGEMTEETDQQEEFIKSVYAMIQDNRKGRLLIKAEVEERNPGLAGILRERLEQQTDMDRPFVDEAKRAQIPLEKRRGSDPAFGRPLCCPRCGSARCTRTIEAAELYRYPSGYKMLAWLMQLAIWKVRGRTRCLCEVCGLEWYE